MGECTVVSFTLPKDKSEKRLKRRVADLVYSYKLSFNSGEGVWKLEIMELNLKDSLFILDDLKREFSLYFTIENGRY